jgi:alkanesulfonate monooxygenase SsuD/methylene tetrahydromethanopterin reductase-like flavin-dependent oxidoreductase (luciferase family)
MLPTITVGKVPGKSLTTTGATGSYSGSTGAALAAVCTQAERLGADSLWACDHLFWPHPIVECFSALAIAASATSQVALGSCVLQLPLRDAATVAKQAATLQHLADGRFILGLGVGSHEGEYATASVDFASRGRRMDDSLAVLFRAWGNDADDRYRLDPAPQVPLWFGGSGPAVLRRTGAMGDGWIPVFLTPEDYRIGLDRLADAALAAGRTPTDIARAVVVFLRVGDAGHAFAAGSEWLSSLYGIPPRAFARHLVCGPADECAATIDAFRRAGAEHVVVMVADDDPLEHFEALRSALAPGASRSAVEVSA